MTFQIMKLPTDPVGLTVEVDVTADSEGKEINDRDNNAQVTLQFQHVAGVRING